jgi:hypothetical protein
MSVKLPGDKISIENFPYPQIAASNVQEQKNRREWNRTEQDGIG